MDWLRLFALLIAVASVQILAEGPKKKIRIHLPQKVKHIHHHKKIYITNHPAPAASQYAPAYLPSAEGAVAVPTNVALPAVAGLVPLNSVELYDESQSRLPGNAPSASKLLPLYRARGYYGPTPSDWEEQEYDLSPPAESADNTVNSNEYAPQPVAPPSTLPKRVKIVKINETPRKKVNRKPKPKRVPTRSRPRPEPEEEHPVTSFHEQFYSDVDGSGTIRKIKKPQRVEKIIDGDTEHIHTYSEEHIHKVVYDDGHKLPGVVGVDPVGSMSALSATRPLLPINNGQALYAIPPEALSGFTAVGSPSQIEYAAYNPRDVTHDHIFHDHGEIPSDVDINKESLGLPPKISYNSQGIRLSGNNIKRPRNKYSNKYPKLTKPSLANDFSYYESIYSPYPGRKKITKPKIPAYDAHSEPNVEDYRPIPSFKLLGKSKPRLYNSGVTEYRQSSAPFSVSSTVVHDYQPKGFPGALPPTGFSKFKDPFVNFRDNYASNFEYDTFASSSNVHTSEDKNDNTLMSIPNTKGKKTSISTQNISFGGQDHQTTVDHLGDSDVSSEINDDDDTPTALENFSSFDETRPTDPQSTPFTIKESSPVHQYYTSMAVKAMHSEQASAPEASNDNFQYAEPPTQSTTPDTQSIATTTSAPVQFFEVQSSIRPSTESPQYLPESDQRRKQRNKNPKKTNVDHKQRYPVIMDYKTDDRPTILYKSHQNKFLQESALDATIRGNLKYGDKI